MATNKTVETSVEIKQVKIVEAEITIIGDTPLIIHAWSEKAKGALGSYIVLAEWEGNENNYGTQTEWKLKGAKMHKVDGKTIKPDTWYTLKDGKFVKVKEETE